MSIYSSLVHDSKTRKHGNKEVSTQRLRKESLTRRDQIQETNQSIAKGLDAVREQANDGAGGGDRAKKMRLVMGYQRCKEKKDSLHKFSEKPPIIR